MFYSVLYICVYAHCILFVCICSVYTIYDVCMIMNVTDWWQTVTQSKVHCGQGRDKEVWTSGALGVWVLPQLQSVQGGSVLVGAVLRWCSVFISPGPPGVPSATSVKPGLPPQGLSSTVPPSRAYTARLLLFVCKLTGFISRQTLLQIPWKDDP